MMPNKNPTGSTRATVSTLSIPIDNPESSSQYHPYITTLLGSLDHRTRDYYCVLILGVGVTELFFLLDNTTAVAPY